MIVANREGNKTLKMTADWSLNFSSSAVSSGGGTHQRATSWICVCWCFGSPTTAQVPWCWVACWLTAGARWGGLWAVTSCWSPANMLCCAALSTTGTPLPQRGQVRTATSGCLSKLVCFLFKADLKNVHSVIKPDNKAHHSSEREGFIGKRL